MVSAERNLWEATAGEPLGAAPLASDESADAVVIGGGYTGCAAALAFAEAGARVHLIEAHTVGHGGSGRNVGLVNAGLWLNPEEVEALLGREAGARLNRILAGAPARVFDLVERHGIACEATRSGTLHCAHSPSGYAGLGERARQLAERGAEVELLDAGRAMSLSGARGIHGGLLDRRAGTVQPLGYCRGLARAARAAGAVLSEGSAVTAIERRDDRWRVATAGGSVSAGMLLLATNIYHEGVATPFAARVVRVSFFQCATAPLDPAIRAPILPERQGCWDTAQVMSSFRLDAAGRLVIGAVGSLDGAAAPLHRAWARRKLRALFPAAADAPFEHFWTGNIAMTTEYLPRVVEMGPRALAVYGYSGRGIGPGTVFGAAAAESLLAGDPGKLPVAPGRHAAGAFDALKAPYYDLGTALWHLVSARLPPR